MTRDSELADDLFAISLSEELTASECETIVRAVTALREAASRLEAIGEPEFGGVEIVQGETVSVDFSYPGVVRVTLDFAEGTRWGAGTVAVHRALPNQGETKP